MLGAIVGLYLLFWMICFGIWYGTNSALNSHASIPSFMRPGFYWWAEYGVSFPTGITFLTALILIPIGVYRLRKQREREEIEKIARENDRRMEELRTRREQELRRMQEEARRREEQKQEEIRRRQEERRRNLEDMDSTESERELRRRLRGSEGLR